MTANLKTIGDFITYAERYEYSKEYFDLLKESQEILLLEAYFKSFDYITESGISDDSGFICEGKNKDEGKKDTVASRVKGLLANAFGIIKNALKFLTGLFTKIVDWFEKKTGGEGKKMKKLYGAAADKAGKDGQEAYQKWLDSIKGTPLVFSEVVPIKSDSGPTLMLSTLRSDKITVEASIFIYNPAEWLNRLSKLIGDGGKGTVDATEEGTVDATEARKVVQEMEESFKRVSKYTFTLVDIRKRLEDLKRAEQSIDNIIENLKKDAQTDYYSGGSTYGEVGQIALDFAKKFQMAAAATVKFFNGYIVARDRADNAYNTATSADEMEENPA